MVTHLVVGVRLILRWAGEFQRSYGALIPKNSETVPVRRALLLQVGANALQVNEDKVLGKRTDT